MSLSLSYPIYQLLAAITSTLTVVHVGVLIFAPPLHAYDLSSLLLWAGSVPSFGILIWAYCRTIEGLFHYFNIDGFRGDKGVRSSSNMAAEDARFRAIFVMAATSAAILTVDVSQLWWAMVSGLIQWPLSISHEEANRLYELFTGLFFLFLTILATGLCGLALWGTLLVPFHHLRKIGVEAGVKWIDHGRVTEEPQQAVELVNTTGQPTTC